MNMETDRLRECLSILDMSQPRFADICDVNERTMRRMASGKTQIPANVAAIAEILVMAADTPMEEKITDLLEDLSVYINDRTRAALDAPTQPAAIPVDEGACDRFWDKLGMSPTDDPKLKALLASKGPWSKQST